MKKNYIILFFLLTLRISMAQSIIFEYDEAGNRILRKPDVALPVSLISFTATKVHGDPEGFTALLNWQTSSEINADRFDIERSQDGKKWNNLGNVSAYGGRETSSLYSFTDKSPMNGENLYRLKMIDRADGKDGSSAYSRIQSLSFDYQISFYPNPVKDLLKIKGIFTGAPVAGTIQLYNTSGKSVLSLGNIPANGIDISGLPTGVYMIKIFLKDGTSTIRKVVKE